MSDNAKLSERAVNRYLQYDYFCKRFQRKPGWIRSVQYVTNVQQIEKMVTSIKCDKFWPNVCGVDCEFVVGAYKSCYKDWKQKYFKEGVPTHAECNGPFIRLMQISQGIGMVWVIDFFQFNHFPPELKKFFCDRTCASIWFDAQNDMRALHRTFNVITTKTVYDRKNCRYLFSVDMMDPLFFCYGWNAVDIKDVLMKFSADESFQPLDGKFSLHNCAFGMFAHSPLESYQGENYFDNNKSLVDLTKSKLFNKFCIDAVLTLDLGFCTQRMYSDIMSCSLPIPDSDPLQKQFLLNMQKNLEEDLFHILQDKIKYFINEVSAKTSTSRKHKILLEEDDDDAMSNSEFYEILDPGEVVLLVLFVVHICLL